MVAPGVRPATCFVGLGANLGDAAGALRSALQSLDALDGTAMLKASRLYRTRAWGITSQPDFINAVAMLRTTLPAPVLLEHMLRIEREAGRERRSDGSDRWGPRTLDLDLLLYDDAVIDLPGLRVPHPHLHERAFVLLPLVEIAPDVVVPTVGPARDALATIDCHGVEALPYAGPAATP